MRTTCMIALAMYSCLAGQTAPAQEFSLAHDRISLTDFPSSSAYNRFRKQFFAQGKMFKSYPALKICRLATDR